MTTHPVWHRDKVAIDEEDVLWLEIRVHESEIVQDYKEAAR